MSRRFWPVIAKVELINCSNFRLEIIHAFFTIDRDRLLVLAETVKYGRGRYSNHFYNSNNIKFTNNKCIHSRGVGRVKTTLHIDYEQIIFSGQLHGTKSLLVNYTRLNLSSGRQCLVPSVDSPTQKGYKFSHISLHTFIHTWCGYLVIYFRILESIFHFFFNIVHTKPVDNLIEEEVSPTR